MTISNEAIHRPIYSILQVSLNKKLIELLVLKKPRRRTHKKRRGDRNKIINQGSIYNRPKHIELRNQVGYWESDLVTGRDHKSVIVIIMEYTKRINLIIQLKSKKAMEVANEFSIILNKLNPI